MDKRELEAFEKHGELDIVKARGIKVDILSAPDPDWWNFTFQSRIFNVDLPRILLVNSEQTSVGHQMVFPAAE
jgi:hypothetical protein